MSAPFAALGPHALNRATLALVLRYTAISGVALSLDMAVFLALLASDVAPVPASVAGYLCGTQLHWLLSTRTVFAAGVRKAWGARRVQHVLFFGSAAIGLACNAGIVAASEALAVPLVLGKLAAIGTSFVLVLLLRATVIFACKPE
jgi:putative flippase GtrA